MQSVTRESLWNRSCFEILMHHKCFFLLPSSQEWVSIQKHLETQFLVNVTYKEYYSLLETLYYMLAFINYLFLYTSNIYTVCYGSRAYFERNWTLQKHLKSSLHKFWQYKVQNVNHCLRIRYFSIQRTAYGLLHHCSVGKVCLHQTFT